MKILIIGNGPIGTSKKDFFVNKHIGHFCEELDDSGFDVGYLQFRENIEENKSLLNYKMDNKILIHSIRLNSKSTLLNKFISYIKIIKKLIYISKQYDYIYIFYPGHTPTIAAILSLLIKKRYALYVRGEYGLKTKIGKILIKKADFILTVSPLLKDAIITENNNIKIIAPMIDFTNEDILLEKKHINKNKVSFLFVGRIENRKGINELSEAIEILNRESNNFYFNIVGGGELFTEIQDKLLKYDNIKLYGEISDKDILLSIYRKCDIFVFPSHDEGFPRVLYEAMMAKNIILTTMVGGIGGLMKNEHNCLSLNVKDTNSIVASINRIVKDKELQEKLLNQATEDITNLFNGKLKKHSILLKEMIEENE